MAISNCVRLSKQKSHNENKQSLLTLHQTCVHTDLKISLSLMVKNIVQYSVLFYNCSSFFFKNPFVLGSGQRSSAVVHSGSQDPYLMSCLCWSQTVSAEESTSSPETEVRDEEKTCTGNTGTYWQEEGWLNILVCYRKQDQQMKQFFCLTLICAHIHTVVTIFRIS